MYIYPDNLKSKATMWLWQLKDLAITGIILLLSVFAFAATGVWFLLVLAGLYAFLTIQVEDTKIMDAELSEVMGKMYEKYVPQAVREYIENRGDVPPAIKKTAKPSAKNQTAGTGNGASSSTGF